MRRVGTEEASLPYPASGTRLEANPVLLELAEWRHQVGWWRPKPVMQKISRHRVGSEVAASSGPLEADLTAHLCATQWMGVGWPPWGGCPQEVHWRAAGAMFVGIVTHLQILIRKLGCQVMQQVLLTEKLFLPVPISNSGDFIKLTHIHTFKLPLHLTQGLIWVHVLSD